MCVSVDRVQKGFSSGPVRSFLLLFVQIVWYHFNGLFFFDFFSSIGICSIVVEFGGVDPHCCGLYT